MNTARCTSKLASIVLLLRVDVVESPAVRLDSWECWGNTEAVFECHRFGSLTVYSDVSRFRYSKHFEKCFGFSLQKLCCPSLFQFNINLSKESDNLWRKYKLRQKLKHFH